jgi:hypothetical protein
VYAVQRDKEQIAVRGVGVTSERRPPVSFLLAGGCDAYIA